ncbi:MAG: DUF3108 domain-containing protein [Myxococcota bacterium]
MSLRGLMGRGAGVLLATAAVGLMATDGHAGDGASEVPLVRVVSHANAPVDVAPPLALAGEQYQFAVRYMGMVGAYANMRVERLQNGALSFVGDIENTSLLRFIFRIKDRFQSLTDPSGATTMQTRLWQEENGSKRYREESYFADRVVTLERSASGERTRSVPVPRRPMDPLSSLFWLRGQRLHDGDRVHGAVFANNRVFDSEMRVAGREKIFAGTRAWNAVRLTVHFSRDGHPVTDVNATVWVSDDDKRIPLKAVANTTYGAVSATLTR